MKIKSHFRRSSRPQSVQVCSVRTCEGSSAVSSQEGSGKSGRVGGEGGTREKNDVAGTFRQDEPAQEKHCLMCVCSVVVYHLM